VVRLQIESKSFDEDAHSKYNAGHTDRKYTLDVIPVQVEASVSQTDQTLHSSQPANGTAGERPPPQASPLQPSSQIDTWRVKGKIRPSGHENGNRRDKSQQKQNAEGNDSLNGDEVYSINNRRYVILIHLIVLYPMFDFHQLLMTLGNLRTYIMIVSSFCVNEEKSKRRRIRTGHNPAPNNGSRLLRYHHLDKIQKQRTQDRRIFPRKFNQTGRDETLVHKFRKISCHNR
jgi:hypothetical protein